ncbi:hypothetical protein [Leptospira saintgironsiae]|uniref:hypothetical protein n=1 Tax=Leptospira saintgironsiae TaxID=2023183 RepID=UPI001FCA77EB|nr:hypothetical protein [Leptospira saintgironsiae]
MSDPPEQEERKNEKAAVKIKDLKEVFNLNCDMDFSYGNPRFFLGTENLLTSIPFPILLYSIFLIGMDGFQLLLKAILSLFTERFER